MKKTPRLAMLNDIAGFGRCSSMVSIPVISALGVQVCPIPTCVYSNHLGFPYCKKIDLSRDTQEYIKVWQDLGLSFQGFYCGFLGSEHQIENAIYFHQAFQPEFMLLDPVMGDHGKLYSSLSEHYIEAMKQLLPYAAILTPNLTEACLLTDTPYKEAFSQEELLTLCQRLAAPNQILIITGVRASSEQPKQALSMRNYIYQDNTLTYLELDYAYPNRPGTGDLFASILAALCMQEVEIPEAVSIASDFIAKAIAYSHESEIPVIEGVSFEPLLPLLMQKGLDSIYSHTSAHNNSDTHLK